MPRLKSVNPETDSGPGAEILNGPLKQKQINIFKGIATNSGVLKAFLGFAGGIKAGALTTEDHEVIALVSAQLRHCEYCSAAHTMVAQGEGIDEAHVLAIRKGVVDDPKQQALIDFISKTIETNGFVSDEDLADFRSAGYNDEAVIEVIAGIAVNYFTNLFNHVNETEIDFPIPAAV